MTTSTRTRKPRSTKPVVADIDVADEPIIADDVDTNDDDVELESPKARKYFSHANCTHARKGEAGKVARATCRRDIRAWLKAEEEFNNTDELLAV